MLVKTPQNKSSKSALHMIGANWDMFKHVH
jgi:hypothetical protein